MFGSFRANTCFAAFELMSYFNLDVLIFSRICTIVFQLQKRNLNLEFYFIYVSNISSKFHVKPQELERQARAPILNFMVYQRHFDNVRSLFAIEDLLEAPPPLILNGSRSDFWNRIKSIGILYTLRKAFQEQRIQIWGLWEMFTVP